MHSAPLSCYTLICMEVYQFPSIPFSTRHAPQTVCEEPSPHIVHPNVTLCTRERAALFFSPAFFLFFFVFFFFFFFLVTPAAELGTSRTCALVSIISTYARTRCPLKPV